MAVEVKFAIPGQRVDIEEAIAAEGDAGEETVVEGAFQHIQIAAVAMQQEHAVVPHGVGDGGAGLGIGREVGQFVIVSEGFTLMARTDAAMNIELAPDDIFPNGVYGVDIGVGVGERCHVGHARIHVNGTYSVAHRFFLLHNGQVILHIAGVAVGDIEVAPMGIAALVEEKLGEVEVALFAGNLVELDQPHLDLLVTRHVAAFAGAKDPIHEIGTLEGDIEEGALACAAIVGNGGFVEMADVVEFVANAQI